MGQALGDWSRRVAASWWCASGGPVRSSVSACHELACAAGRAGGICTMSAVGWAGAAARPISMYTRTYGLQTHTHL